MEAAAWRRRLLLLVQVGLGIGIQRVDGIRVIRILHDMKSSVTSREIILFETLDSMSARKLSKNLSGNLRQINCFSIFLLL